MSTPTVGTPVTYSCGSDRYAGKVTEVKRNGKTLVVRMTAGWEETFTLKGDGAYRLKGYSFGRLVIGEARDYRDPGF